MDAVDQAVSLSTAKTHLAGLVQAAETGEVVHISRHGKPVAVLISEEAYASLLGHQSRRGVWTAIADWRAVAHGRKQQRLNSYLQGLLTSGLTVLPYDGKAALWHGEQRARLEARGLRPPFADGQIAAIAATQALVVVTRNAADFEAFEGFDVLNWFSQS